MNEQITIPDTLNKTLIALMGIGLIVFVAGLFFAPERIWANFLMGEFYIMGLGLGAGVFIALQYVSGAAWGTAYRRIPEAMTGILPYALAGIVVLIFGIHSLYEWSHPSMVAEDALLQMKSPYLNITFFVGRLIFYIIGWIFLSRKITVHSRKQDEDGRVEHTHSNVKYSAALIVFGAITFSFASIDLLMSLQPHWYSTVFGFLNLSGMFLNILAAVTICAVIMRWMGYDHIVTRDHLHDLGNWIMSMSVFWVYMWVSQHLLIWYSNIPEETSYYIFRHFGGWGSLSFMNLMLNWLIPFVVLLSKANKRNEKTLLQVSLVVMLGHWLDLYIMVMPVTFGETPLLGIWEIGLVPGMIALFFWVTFRGLERYNPVPVNDPYLVESLPENQLPEERQIETGSLA